MNYFMSDIHGAADAYFRMKEKIGFRNNDEMYILGDIFDGEGSTPEQCLQILEDIINSNNIHLILGNHEYAHVMYFLCRENEMLANEWVQHISSPSFLGRPLLMHLNGKLSEKEIRRYVSFLLSCEVAELVKIGKKYFYLLHGSPAVLKSKDEDAWQYDVVSSHISLHKNYGMAIQSSPGMHVLDKKEKENMIIVAGHTQTKFFFEEDEALLKKYYPHNIGNKPQKIIFENQRMLIDCGCRGNTVGCVRKGWISNLACVGIDAAGYFTEYLTREDKNE